MSSTEPLIPHPDDGERIAAAEPGAGAPAPAPGFGRRAEEPDQVERESADDVDPGQVDTVFRTPTPPEPSG